MKTATRDRGRARGCRHHDGLVALAVLAAALAPADPASAGTDTGCLGETPTIVGTEDDDALYVRLTPTTPELERSTPISCAWRPGDPW